MFGEKVGPCHGIAPRARVIAATRSAGATGCPAPDLVAGIDAAVADGVDVINYSIGERHPRAHRPPTTWPSCSPPTPTCGWPHPRQRRARRRARRQPGVRAVGDGGRATRTTARSAPRPGSATASSPSAPASPTAPAAPEATGRLGGARQRAVPGPARPAHRPSRRPSPTRSCCACAVSTGVDKSRVVAAAGGAGTFLYNPNDVQALVTDSHWVPSVHVNLTTGRGIKAYITAAGAGARASLDAPASRSRRAR